MCKWPVSFTILCMIVIGVVDSFKGVSQHFGARMRCAYQCCVTRVCAPFLCALSVHNWVLEVWGGVLGVSCAGTLNGLDVSLRGPEPVAEDAARPRADFSAVLLTCLAPTGVRSRRRVRVWCVVRYYERGCH